MPLSMLARSTKEAGDMALAIQRLFQESHAFQAPVDAPSFRVDNEELIPVLDRLEQTPYLKREGDQYRLGMAALAELYDSRAKALIEDCDQILGLMRSHYRNKSTRGQPKKLVEIAHE